MDPILQLFENEYEFWWNLSVNYAAGPWRMLPQLTMYLIKAIISVHIVNQLYFYGTLSSVTDTDSECLVAYAADKVF